MTDQEEELLLKPHITSLKGSHNCVSCGILVDNGGYCTDNEKNEGVPCCYDCYAGTKLRIWMDNLK